MCVHTHVCIYVAMYVYVCAQCVEPLNKDTSWEFQYSCLLDDYYSLRSGCIFDQICS